VEILGAPLVAPLSIPGFLGQLRIDVTQPYIAVVAGVVPPSGVHTLNVTVPGTPWMIGQTLFSQALRLGGVNEFDNALRLLITP
jgi:hypothetical protein